MYFNLFKIQEKQDISKQKFPAELKSVKIIDMKILAIETSCDETALCVIKAEGDFHNAKIEILGESLLSQVNMHRKFGGVYPTLAKREHSTNLTPMLSKTLKEAKLYKEALNKKIPGREREEIKKILEKENTLSQTLIPFLDSTEKPKIDKIAVTYGPGLEPALWVGINFAKAISKIWNIPIIPINHMEGHIFSALLKKEYRKAYTLRKTGFPALALLISGGHTEFVLIKKYGKYEIIGSTRDDALGEAFDKVARMLNLPYPGGPEISKLTEKAREENIRAEEIDLPRPMINSDNLDFSFSGIKTAVLYKLKKVEELDEKIKMKVALEFENAITEVLVKKTKRAIEKNDIKTLLLGGGVSANKHIKRALNTIKEKSFKNLEIYFPNSELSMDNSIMIAVAGYFNSNKDTREDINAEGNLKIDN